MQQIFVQSCGETYTVEVPVNASYETIKAIIMENLDIAQDFFLTSNGSIVEAGVESQSIVSVVFPMEAGGKKKKKKVYTTPKKIKHKNKKIKMRVLSHYNIEGDKITRTRIECEVCGAGYFMANHGTRHTCGNCQRTLVNKA